MSDDAAKKKEGQKDDDEDDRLEFLLNYLTKSYRLKQEKWNKMITIDENKVSNKSSCTPKLLCAITFALVSDSRSFKNSLDNIKT